MRKWEKKESERITITLASDLYKKLRSKQAKIIESGKSQSFSKTIDIYLRKSI